ncbi:MAG: hypothetical protein A3J38_06500 [Gammaproteobacteria bacterium RIFCSPHIGHO2_12_FULL_45_9]|nr:MAG: hypothetical protein A3J38_06500 [Gammaproteobacteria bacterium RIFCSPHIGHO2_12_FULL_45_9]
MPIIFYPQEEDVNQKSTIDERLEMLAEAAQRYKAVIMDLAAKAEANPTEKKKGFIPSEMAAAYNWDAIARLLREIREMPENVATNKSAKADKLAKLAEIYEVLRAAKMPKLEAVRLALINEANQVRGGAAQVA